VRGVLALPSPSNLFGGGVTHIMPPTMRYVVPAAHGHVMVEATNMRACDGAHCMSIPYIHPRRRPAAWASFTRHHGSETGLQRFGTHVSTALCHVHVRGPSLAASSSVQPNEGSTSGMWTVSISFSALRNHREWPCSAIGDSRTRAAHGASKIYHLNEWDHRCLSYTAELTSAYFFL
jgi:hypothetical protein